MYRLRLAATFAVWRRPACAWVWAMLSLACVATAGAESGALDATLTRLQSLAGREPARAQAELDALLADAGRGPSRGDRSAQLRVELIRLLIADAQYRSDDVLAIAGRLQEQSEVLSDARLAALVEHARFGAFFQLGRNDQAEQAVQRELEQARRSQDDDSIGQALVDNARQQMKRGDFEQACASIADAERHARGAQIAAEVWFSNAVLARDIGDWSQALQSFRDAYVKFAAVNDRTGEADSQAGAGTALNQLGRAAEAIAPLDAARLTYREVGDREGEAIVQGELASSQADLGRTAEALAISAEAIESLIRTRSPMRVAQLQLERARFLLTLKRAAEAYALVGRAREAALGSEDLALHIQYYDISAAVQAVLGRPQAAYLESQRALSVQRRRTEQLVARQLAAQRGRLQSELLTRENALLRNEADANQGALQAAHREARLQGIAIALAALFMMGGVVALWRQRVLLRRIARMAQTDPLTGIANRRQVLEHGQRMMNRCLQGGRPFALLLLDLDRFKTINDGHGHAAGDAALCAVSEVLRRHLRPDDQLGRYGGEEFAVTLPGADRDEAGAVAERLRAAVAALKPDWAPGADPLTLSGGIAVATVDRPDFAQLLVRADQALYRAKDAGRNRIEFDLD